MKLAAIRKMALALALPLAGTYTAYALNVNQALIGVNAVNDNKIADHDMVFVIQAGSGTVYPDWITQSGLDGAELEALQDKYDTWAANQSGIDLEAGDYSHQFLMNSTADSSVLLAITNIVVTGDTVTLAIEGQADESPLDLGQINGLLYLRTATTLDGPWDDKTFDSVLVGRANPSFDSDGSRFFQPAVGISSPPGATPLVPLAP